jgi:hypothetical protein
VKKKKKKKNATHYSKKEGEIEREKNRKILRRIIRIHSNNYTQTQPGHRFVMCSEVVSRVPYRYSVHYAGETSIFSVGDDLRESKSETNPQNPPLSFSVSLSLSLSRSSFSLVLSLFYLPVSLSCAFVN